MPKKTEKSLPKQKSVFYQSVGRRKESTARVRLTIKPEEISIKGKSYKKGDILVNEKLASDYFRDKLSQKLYLQPFELTQTQGRFLTTVKVEGGGLSGQLQAIIHGLARALEKVDKEKYRHLLKNAGLLTRDPRTKERRKAGFAQKARAKKQSPKR